MPTLLSGFDWTTPFVADAAVRLALPLRVGPFGLRCSVPGSKAAGRACPVRHAGSVDVFLEAIAASHPGDILVIDNGGRVDEGCIGDLVVGEAAVCGLQAILCWGAHRDSAAIAALPVPVWSAGVCPNGPVAARARVTEALTSARFGSVLVTSDDWVFADDDGVVVVGTADVERVIDAALDIATRENAQAIRLRNGETLRQQLRLDHYLAARRTDPSITFRQHLASFAGAIET